MDGIKYSVLDGALCRFSVVHFWNVHYNVHYVVNHSNARRMGGCPGVSRLVVLGYEIFNNNPCGSLRVLVVAM